MNKKQNLVVTKSNSLVEAAYYLTLAEQRLMLLAISRLDSRSELDSRISHTITAQDAARVFGVGRTQSYRLLEEAAERLYERSVTIHAPDPSKPQSNKLVTRWVSSVLYQPHDGAVSLKFAPDILPFLAQLKERFCSYQLEHIAQMSSIYAVRLYELLIQWREVGSRTVDISWLRERFDLGEKYASIRDLKRFVIVPAIEQINAHSDLDVTWEQHKRGRVVAELTFSFSQKSIPEPQESSKSPEKKSNRPPRPKLTNEYIQQHAYPGESWEEARERLRVQIEREYGPERKSR